MMKKRTALTFVSLALMYSLLGVFVYFMPLMTDSLTEVTDFAVKASSPSYVASQIKETLSCYIIAPDGNDNTTISDDDKQVMHSIIAKDSEDNTDITATPDDIQELMKQAEETLNEEDAVGKTSEEPYHGGGTIITEGVNQIQSKIPFDVYNPDIKKLLEQDTDLSIGDKSKPTVLIYHSHTTEAYSLLDVGYYNSSDARSKNTDRNMVRVGDELTRYLEKHGFVVIHDTEIHDEEYNSAYDNSREVVEKYLEEYPSIEITIDVHRDDITYSDKTKVKPTAVINGKKAARMMIIAGCEYNRVKNFPNWEKNLRFDLQVQNKVNELYEGLMRPILFSERKYNMYETDYSFLLEVGTDANTLEEACYSARLFGDALGQLLNEKYVTKQE
ncbi:MAG: stage II sporulation protein P [Eubacteriales bacterium]|nr:stage II sporulation protein P [Eubacteriales bacterium]